MPDAPTLENALIDVRKAYRLLWCYQKRVFDMVKLVVEEFDDMTFYNWRTLHAGHPCRTGTDPMSGRWTWDMLPMVHVSYLFLPGGGDHNSTLPGQWMLEVFVNSDDGFSKAEDGSEPDPVDFKAAEESTSKVSLFAWYCRGETSKNWINGVWQAIDWPEVDGEKIDYADPPFTVFRRDFDLATLPDKDAVRAAAASFRATASEALGVSLA
jgi:hypothetical protein